MEMIDVLKRLEQISQRSPEEIGRAIDSASKITPHTGAVKEGVTTSRVANSAQMFDVLNKLSEISNRSPEEVGRAISSVAKLNGIPVSEGVKIDLSGEDAVLGQILKLAGMINAETSMTMAADNTPAVATIATPIAAIGSQQPMNPMGDETSITMDDATNRPYTNSPHEIVKPTRAAVPSGTDLARQKGTYPKVAGGDNPTHVAVDFD
jgi:hypothetical protein